MILDPALALTTAAIAIALEIQRAVSTANTRERFYPDPPVGALTGGIAGPQALLKSVDEYTP